MKSIKNIFFALLFFVGFGAKAQIAFPIDSNVTGVVYTGLLSGVKYLVDSQKVAKFITYRVGAHAKWQINSKLKLNSFAVLELGTSKAIGLYNFALIYSPTKWLSITGGHTPPPLPLIMRPYPLSANSQFETWTQARIPGATPSVYFTIGNKKLKGYGGVSLRDNKTEFETELTYGAVTIGSYVRDTSWGIAGQVSTKKYFQVTVFDNSWILANTSIVNIRDYSLYCDVGYNFKLQKLPRFEIRFSKNFYSKYVQGLFGLGYQGETNSINAYLFFHL